MSDRQKLFCAFVVSVIAHAVIGFILYIWPSRHISDEEKPKPDLSRLTVIIMPPKPADLEKLIAAAPTPPPMHLLKHVERPDLDSDGLTTSKKAPEHSIYQSDADMVAGSLLPATGNVPLPSEEGARGDFVDFANRRASAGKGTVSDAAKAARAAQSMPEQTPFAVTQVQNSPQSQSTPQPTPFPTPGPDMIALGTPTPTPAQLAENTARLTLRGHVDIAPLAPQTPPSPNQPPQPAQQPGMPG